MTIWHPLPSLLELPGISSALLGLSFLLENERGSRKRKRPLQAGQSTNAQGRKDPGAPWSGRCGAVHRAREDAVDAGDKAEVVLTTGAPAPWSPLPRRPCQAQRLEEQRVQDRSPPRASGMAAPAAGNSAPLWHQLSSSRLLQGGPGEERNHQTGYRPHTPEEAGRV